MFKRAPQCLRQALRIVSHIIHMAQTQAAQRHQFNDLCHVFILAFTGQYFIADDDQAEIGNGV